MKCDLCDNPAVVHEVTLKDGIKNEVHLCEEHASQAGIALPHQPLDKVLTQFVIQKAGKPARSAARKVCRSCGLSFPEFRHSGVLGCADCYDAFAEQLSPMIERAQNGGTSHAGKCPRRGGKSIDQQLLINRIAKELDDAVAAEQFERAVELRDRLRDLKASIPAPASAPASAPAPRRRRPDG